MKGGSAPYGACDWCTRAILEGEFCIQITRRLIQPVWKDPAEAWRCTELRSDGILILCRDCGAIFDPQDLREANPEAPDELEEDDFSPAALLHQIRPWAASEGLEYAAYVRGVLRTAGLSELGKARALRNAVIDYAAACEGAPQHFGDYESVTNAEWLDPAYEAVGSCSRAPVTREAGDAGSVLRCRRDLSFVSVDYPNSLPGGCRATYLGMLMRPLRYLSHEENDLYGWLKVLFNACAGKPVAYFSRYTPGPKIQALAAKKNVQLLPLPLDTIPANLRERNRCFHLRQATPAE